MLQLGRLSEHRRCPFLGLELKVIVLRLNQPFHSSKCCYDPGPKCLRFYLMFEGLCCWNVIGWVCLFLYRLDTT